MQNKVKIPFLIKKNNYFTKSKILNFLSFYKFKLKNYLFSYLDLNDKKVIFKVLAQNDTFPAAKMFPVRPNIRNGHLYFFTLKGKNC